MSRDAPGITALTALRGQEAALQAFSAALSNSTPGEAQRVAGAYLLHGPEGVGRGLGARGFAAAGLKYPSHLRY